ncbi:minor tail protein [Microbacterium phage Pumpernickel]|uniref:Minor tail protein n=1 Tax=Microbacterium phage Pumpernickel TaxID=2885983 RepID=A0AAE9C2V6_9CAUD|nr:minor tail protein [Microbacterium phage Pumpernickel]UDL15886.1 minor tail protein [Microbacterium phage Pumpernickel]
MTRVNLAQDPSLRSKTSNAYAGINGAQIAYSSEYGFYGEGSLKVTRAAQNNSGVSLATVPVTAGLKYAFSAYVRIPVTIPEAEHAEQIIEVSWANSIGQVLRTDQTTSLYVDTDTTWYRVGGVWTAPTGATVATMRIFQPLAGSEGSAIYLDAFLIEQSAYVGGYFDELTTAAKMQIVNRGLSAVPQVINGVRLGADVIVNDLVLNTIDEDNTIWVVTGIDGWWGQTTPELPDIPRGTEDGSYDVQARLTSRTVVVSGFFIPQDAEASLSKSIDRLVTAANMVRKGGWFVANENPNKAAWVRLGNKPVIETVNARGKTEFQLTLRAGDPIKYHWNDSDPDGFSTAQYNSSNVPDAVHTNLFTNPSFGDAPTTLEIRRNFNTNPRFISNTGWSATGNVSWVGNGQASIADAAVTGTLLPYESTAAPAAPGEVWTVSRDFSVPAGAPPITLQYSISPYAGATAVTSEFVYSPNVTIQPGETVRVSVTSKVLGSTVTHVRAIPYLRENPGNTGRRLNSDRVLLEKIAYVGEYFDGSTTPDSDLVPSWTGTADNSASILTGNIPSLVVGSYDSTSWTVRSNQWASSGTYSLKIIPRMVNTAYYYRTATALGLTVGKTYTAVGKVRLAAPQGTTAVSYPRRSIRYRVNGVYVADAAAPNLAGVHEPRITFTVENPTDLFMITGGTLADGPVWWDDLTFVEGVYTGPAFSGNSTSNVREQYKWTGTPHASTSVRTAYNEDILDNIGTADVTGVFTITGPAGAGTRIYNATTDETMVLAERLRGAGVVAAATSVEAKNGVATVYTAAPNELRVGDQVSLLNMVIPFSESNQARTVTAVSEVFPYSFSFAISTDDIDKMPSDGQVYLLSNDVLTIDTYNRSVTYNGEVAGHRNKLTTLTDWVHFAPGKNVIEYFDDVTDVEVISKELVSNEVTLTTAGIHYLIPGEPITVSLPVSVPLAKKSLTSNKVTMTTAVPHGYSVGDTVNIESTETSNVVTKSRTSNVVTLTTENPHGVSVSDNIVVALATTAAAQRKQLTSNVATITTQNNHGFSAGDSVTVALPATASVASKALSANQATITTTAAHNYAVGDSITVSMPASATIVGKSRNGSQIVMTTSTAHGFSVSDQINVSLPTSATPTGNLSANATDNLVTVTTTATHGFMPGDKITIAGSGTTSFNGSKVVETVPSATTFTFRDWTITSNSTPSSAGMTIVNDTNQSYNGNKTILSASGTTFAYNL